MNSKRKYYKALTNVAIYLVVILVFVFFVPKLLVFFLPFVIGWIISCIANPIVKFLEKKIHFKRKMTSAIALVLVLAIVISICYGILYVLITQGMGLFDSLPDLWNGLEYDLNQIGDMVHSWFSNVPQGLVSTLNGLGDSIDKYMSTHMTDWGTPAINALSNFAMSLPSAIIGIIMCLLSAYFFSTERNNLADLAEKYFPVAIYSKIDAAYRGLRRAVGGYFVAQLKIEVWVFFITFIGLVILGVDYAAIIALGISFLDFLPFFGAGLIMVPWGAICLFNEDYFVGVGMFIVWGIGQIVRQLIQPKVLGDQVGLNPLPTLFLLFIGFEFGGMLGMIIAVPIGIIIVSLYEEGLFRGLVDSVRLLGTGISNFRRFTDEELASIAPTVKEVEEAEDAEERKIDEIE